jgi:hypothetical protein
MGRRAVVALLLGFASSTQGASIQGASIHDSPRHC